MTPSWGFYYIIFISAGKTYVFSETFDWFYLWSAVVPACWARLVNKLWNRVTTSCCPLFAAQVTSSAYWWCFCSPSLDPLCCSLPPAISVWTPKRLHRTLASCPNPPWLLCLPKRVLPFIWLIWIPAWKTSDELGELLACMTRLLMTDEEPSTSWAAAPEWDTCTRRPCKAHFYLAYLTGISKTYIKQDACIEVFD